jgi:hypothetical protein
MARIGHHHERLMLVAALDLAAWVWQCFVVHQEQG